MLAWCRRRCALAYWWPVCWLSKMLSVSCHVSLCLTPTNPPVFLRPSVLISSPSTSMTDLTYTNVLCFYHPSPLLSFSLYLPLSVPTSTFALLTHSAACDVPSLLSLAVHHWLCPLPEFHLCPRSASASPMPPLARGALRSRSSDRKKVSTSVSADAISSMTQVSRWFKLLHWNGLNCSFSFLFFFYLGWKCVCRVSPTNSTNSKK